MSILIESGCIFLAIDVASVDHRGDSVVLFFSPFFLADRGSIDFHPGRFRTLGKPIVHRSDLE